MDIAKLRDKKKMTQLKLALEVGVSINTIRAWESGVSKPSEKNLKKLMEVLNVLPFAEE